MKRNHLFAIIVSLILLMTAGAQATAAEQGPEGLSAYRDVLNRYHRLIMAGPQYAEAGEGDTGVLDAFSYIEPADAPARFGYAIMDISGDDVPELLIGIIEKTEDGVSWGSEILAAYTLVDGQPKLSFEGWARNRHYYIGKGSFYVSGSSGADQSVFGEYMISPDGTELICIDFCFTDQQGANLGQLSIDPAASKWVKVEPKERAVSEDEFVEQEKQLAARVQLMQLTPFAAYTSSAFTVLARWAKDALVDYSNYDEFTADESDARVRILLSSDSPLADFKVLSITALDADEGGTLRFVSQVLHAQDSLNPDRPLVLNMTFFGDLPSYAISYTDENGTEKIFALTLSGKDGSLQLTPIE